MSKKNLNKSNNFLRQEVECIEAEFQGGIHFLLSNRRTGLIYELPEIGFNVVKALMQGTSIEELTSNIVKEYDVDKETIIKDIQLLISELNELQFINNND